MTIRIRDFNLTHPELHVIHRKDEYDRITFVDMIVEIHVAFGSHEPRSFCLQNRFTAKHWADLDDGAKAHAARRLLHQALMQITDETIELDGDRPFARRDPT